MTTTVRLEALPKLRREHWPLRSGGEGEPPDATPGRAERETPEPRPRRGQSSKPLAGLTIVVVDDDENNLDYFGLALRTYGAVALTASTAVEALRLVRERRPDVVLSDIAMAEHDGYWLVGELRRSDDEHLRRIPVIATTAYGREHSRERAAQAGFDAHLPKPVDPLVLLRTIARVVGRD